MTDSIQEVPQPAPPQHEGPRELKFRNSFPDWAVRGIIFLVFLYFGTAKFKSDAGTPWVVLFDRIGFGQWLRYFTGVLESTGALLVLISSAVEIGLAILVAVLLAAIAITILILHRSADAFVPFAFLCGMIAFWLHRRRV